MFHYLDFGKIGETMLLSLLKALLRFFLAEQQKCHIDRVTGSTPAQHTEQLAMSSSRVSQSLTGPLLVRAEAVRSAVQASAVSAGPRAAPAPLCVRAPWRATPGSW